MSLLYDHITRMARQNPERPAVADTTGEVTYTELLALVEDISRSLHLLGISANASVLLSGNNSIGLLAMVIALVREQVQVFLLDPRSSKEDLEDVLREFPVQHRVFEKGSFDGDFALEQTLLCHQAVFEIDNHPGSAPIGDQPKLYFFSSGSTGRPKAFGFSDERLWKLMENMAAHLDFNAADRSLVPLTITHSHGMMLSLPLLLRGGCVQYLLPNRSKPADILEAVQKNKITVLTGVPYQYNLMLNEPAGNAGSLVSLRYAFCGSAPMSEFLATTFREKFGVRLNQAYGVSEIGPICINLFEEGDNNFRTVGKVMPNIEYKILDDDGSLAQEGELIVRSDFMTGSYYNAPEESAQTYRDGWIHTQDIVREEEHKNIYIVGRRKNFINVSGYKIYPVEVEKVLLSLKGVKDAAVLGIPDEARGQKIRAVVSTFIPMSESDILEFCRQHLAAYKVPHEILIEKELQHGAINKISYAKYSGNPLNTPN